METSSSGEQVVVESVWSKEWVEERVGGVKSAKFMVESELMVVRVVEGRVVGRQVGVGAPKSLSWSCW